jgi:phage shock protein PspC (stress-responsive transcriptional regulator)
MAKKVATETNAHTEEMPPEVETEHETESKIHYKQLFRVPSQGKLAGVCAGLAHYFDMDVTLIRVVFVVLTLASGGFGLLLYLLLAVMIPSSEAEGSSIYRGTNIEDSVRGLGEEMRGSGATDRLRNMLGLGLVLFGIWLLFVQFFPQWLSFNWDTVWPALLVILGLVFLVGSRR